MLDIFVRSGDLLLSNKRLKLYHIIWTITRPGLAWPVILLLKPESYPGGTLRGWLDPDLNEVWSDGTLAPSTLVNLGECIGGLAAQAWWQLDGQLFGQQLFSHHGHWYPWPTGLLICRLKQGYFCSKLVKNKSSSKTKSSGFLIHESAVKSSWYTGGVLNIGLKKGFRRNQN